MSQRYRYVCQKKKDGVTCGNTLRELLIGHNDSAYIDKSYLRYCDMCRTVYILVPREIEMEHHDIPFWEYQNIDQMEKMP